MAKSKSKKRKLKKVSHEEVVKEKPVNPFELRINKVKHAVVGKRLPGMVQGRPGRRRDEADKRRRATLEHELQGEGKSNVFVDRRLGEKDHMMDEEDKKLARYAATRVNKSSVYNLNDEEELTHFGHPVVDKSTWGDNPHSDNDSEDEEIGNKLQAANFGGDFFTRKSNSAPDPDQHKSRKELLDEMIASSKLHKHNQMKNKEDTFELTEKLNTKFTEVLSVVNEMKKQKKADPIESIFLKMQDKLYDNGEKPKIQDIAFELPKSSHVDKEREPEDDRKNSNYDILVNELRFEAKAQATDRSKTYGEVVAEKKLEQDKQEAERIRRMREGAGYDITPKPVRKEEEPINVVYNKEGKIPQLEEQADTSDSDEEEDTAHSEGGAPSGDIYDALQAAQRGDKSTTPDYDATVCEDYDDFLLLVEKNNAKDLSTSIKSFIAAGKDDKLKLINLFNCIIRYIDTCSIDGETLSAIDAMTSHAYTLTHMFPEYAANHLLSYVKSRRRTYINTKKKRIPTFNTLLVVKLVCRLFPVSDFFHAVVTPATVFISEILHHSVIITPQHVARGLFLTTLIYDNVRLSGRLVPAAINFLLGLLTTTTHTDKSQLLHTVPPFRQIGDGTQLLYIPPQARSVSPAPLSLLSCVTCADERDKFKMSALHTAVQLTTQFIQLYHSIPSAHTLFLPIHTKTHSLQGGYGSEIESSLCSLEAAFSRFSEKQQSHLVRASKKPLCLSLYEPKFEMKFDGRKHWGDIPTQQREQKRLKHEVKKEYKGALRELKQDAKFIQRYKQKEMWSRDEERKKLTKRLIGGLRTQEGDYNRLKAKAKFAEKRSKSVRK